MLVKNLKIFKEIFNEEKSSRDQFAEDFGHFPPIPLTDNIQGCFKVVRYSNFSDPFIRLFCAFELINKKNTSVENLTIEAQDLIGFGDFKRLKGELNLIGNKFLRFIVFFIYALPIFIKKGKVVNGYFSPFSENKIFIKKGNAIDSEKITISHEHIHLIQFNNKNIFSIELPSNFLSEKMDSNNHIKYLLDKFEVEARLHEVVLSFYRYHNKLPLTVSGFLGLLVSCEGIGDFVKEVLEISEKQFDFYENYNVRGSKIIDQLEGVLIFIKSDEMRVRFITEVLVVMYGNLISYYGDKFSSNDYMSKINRPNLYDEIYRIA